MTGQQMKRRQMAALELLLTFTLAMNKNENPTTARLYRGSKEHLQHKAVIERLCRELGLDPTIAEDKVRQLACDLMGESRLLIPNRTVSIGMNSDLWHKVLGAGERKGPRHRIRNMHG